MSVLEVREASFAYGRREVFHDVSFSLRQGQVLSVIGPNGSGKSTLLNCLAGLLSEVYRTNVRMVYVKEVGRMACLASNPDAIPVSFAGDDTR